MKSYFVLLDSRYYSTKIPAFYMVIHPHKKIKAELCNTFAIFNKSKDLNQKQVPELRTPNGVFPCLTGVQNHTRNMVSHISGFQNYCICEI